MRNGDEMFKQITRIATAALVAGAVAFAITVSPEANDHKVVQGQHSAKGDRLPLAVKGTACSQHSWPNFEQRCQFDFRSPADKARTVRVIAID